MEANKKSSQLPHPIYLSDEVLTILALANGQEQTQHKQGLEIASVSGLPSLYFEPFSKMWMSTGLGLEIAWS